MERNDLITLWLPDHLLEITASQLDRCFVRLRPAVAEEHRISTAMVYQQLRQLLLIRNVEQVACMP
ncbi:hypothetical protein D3C73_1616100 [compost metagenome]